MQTSNKESPSAQEIDTSIMDPAPDKSLDVSVSFSFDPGEFDEISDTVFLSSDLVLFYLHSHRITTVQPYAFRRLKGAPLTALTYRDQITDIEETSGVLAVMLHALYNTPCSPVPSFETIATAVDKMRIYEISPSVLLTPQSNLYKLILSHAPILPLEVYALASLHMLNELAVESSSHLTSYPLSSITDGMAATIGTTYLLRLFQWRLHRTREMKRIVLKPPYPHPPTRQCPLDRQGRLTEIWATISANIIHTGVTDLTLSLLTSMAEPHLETLDCEVCKEVIENKARYVIVEWNAVPRTIG